MWLFDTVEVQILKSRIQDLERTVEMVNGANQVLQAELEDAKTREANLLEKIFNITGVNKVSVPIQSNEPRQPIPVGRSSVPWPQQRANLEAQARKEYWDKKKAKQDQLDKLEEDILGGIENNGNK